jgi:hypothetical protein
LVVRMPVEVVEERRPVAEVAEVEEEEGRTVVVARREQDCWTPVMCEQHE